MKRFWLPTQKGTELWPQETQQPTKLVIEYPAALGETDVIPAGSPLYKAIANRFGGRLQAFHAKAQQSYALSTNNVHKQRSQFDGARATYVNMFGNETLHLWVADHVVKQLKEEIERYRDVLLVTFEYDDMWGVGVTHSAYMVVPQIQQLPTTLLPCRGVAHEAPVDYADDGTRHPVVQFRPMLESQAYYQTPFVTEAAVGRQRTGLLIDTRPVYGLPIYVVDIYARIGTDVNRGSSCDLIQWDYHEQLVDSDERTFYREFSELLGFPDPFIAEPTIADTDRYIPYDAAPWNEDWVELPIYPGGTTYDPFNPGDHLVVGPDEFPDFSGTVNYETLSSGYQQSTDPALSGTSHYTGEQFRQHLPSGNEPGSTFLYDWVVEYTQETHGRYIYLPEYARSPGPEVARVATIRAKFLSSERDLGIVHVNGTQPVDDGTPCGPYNLTNQYYTYEVRAPYPTKPYDFDLHTATVEPGFNFADQESVAAHLGMHPLCRITFDRKHSVVSISPIP
jgi:hypothetical protein